MDYSEKLKDPRWQKKRLKVFERDNFSCILCQDKETTLNVHHERYLKNPWDANLSDLTTLCKYCHAIVEDLKKVNCKAVHVEIINNNHCVYVSNKYKFFIAIYEFIENNPISIVVLDKYEIERINSILKSL